MNLGIPTEHQIRYLKRRMPEIEELKNHLLLENFELAVAIGHKLKGSGETFGFPMVSVLGNTIEEAALARDKDRTLEAVEQLALSVQDSLQQLLIRNRE